MPKNLFLFSKDENQHYSLIKNFSRLARSPITSDSRKIHICKKCFTHFTKKYLFKKHSRYCSKNETVAVKMPTTNTILNFSSCNNMLSTSKFPYSPIQNPCHISVIFSTSHYFRLFLFDLENEKFNPPKFTSQKHSQK